MINKKIWVQWIQEGDLSIPKILMNNYKKLGLDEIEMMFLLHLHLSIENGNRFPTPDEIALKMTISSNQCAEQLRQLIRRGFLSIEQGSNGESLIAESYSLQPLWEKLLDMLAKDALEVDSQEKETQHVNLYAIFEQEFGRALSPFEAEMLTMWEEQDNHSADVIKYALREAVMSEKRSFRYIDRILFDWKRNGIKTIEQAQQQGRKFRQFQQPQRPQQPQQDYTGTVPFYNWLEQK